MTAQGESGWRTQIVDETVRRTSRWLRFMCAIYAVSFFARAVIHFPASDSVEWYAVSGLFAIAARLP